ncbi:hypothetical protein GWP57_10625 [Gammaproteobacteria bacterium]|nr:hypothetical protein [Gammaproteobacteria bacterium]
MQRSPGTPRALEDYRHQFAACKLPDTDPACIVRSDAGRLHCGGRRGGP